MSASRVKKIRKQVYVYYSIQTRKYFRNSNTGIITADERRQKYQQMKKK